VQSLLSDGLDTPCLVLDVDKAGSNIQRLNDHLSKFDVSLRPHLKTTKSVEVARMVIRQPTGPATVSTLKEAEQFAAAGITDLLYAVGVAPGKLDRVCKLRKAGVDLTIILDSVAQASSVATKSRESGIAIPALIEIDCDGHRSGVKPGDTKSLIEIGETLVAGGAELRGVLTHAGGSYSAGNRDMLLQCAEAERAAVVDAAMTLRTAGLPCGVVSMGSTPTAHVVQDLSGVTEVRAGVFVFFDLVMAGIGVCSVDNIALSVLTTVIGHQVDKGWILADAGWMAMSRDRGTAKQAVDQGYGVVCNVWGEPIEDLIMIDANQEHGVIALRQGANRPLPDLPVGTRLRILPNHACSTGAQHDRYYVVSRDSLEIEAEWPRFSGW
jgi:D-serine deaminase-like pyridoxal phosphate-dependent protein